MHKGESTPAAASRHAFPPPQSRARGGSHPLRCHDHLLSARKPRLLDPQRMRQDAPTEGGRPRGASPLVATPPTLSADIDVEATLPGRFTFLGTISRFGAQGHERTVIGWPSSISAYARVRLANVCFSLFETASYMIDSVELGRSGGARGFGSDAAASTNSPEPADGGRALASGAGWGYGKARPHEEEPCGGAY